MLFHNFGGVFGCNLGFFCRSFEGKKQRINVLGGKNYLLFCFPKLSLSGQKASYATTQA